jgi:hypothetical protein
MKLNISHRPKPPSRWFNIASWVVLIVLLLLGLALLGDLSDERLPPPAEREPSPPSWWDIGGGLP